LVIADGFIDVIRHPNGYKYSEERKWNLNIRIGSSMKQVLIFCSMRITQWIGIHGERKLSIVLKKRINPFFSALATPPAIGAM
jgi:hypothetical protein